MCVVCHLSTDREIVDIPFDENDSKFNIQRIEERPSCLTKRFVYYCGSSMCCGCGFGNMNITEDILQKTDAELQVGKLSEETQLLWWRQNETPPENMEEFGTSAERIRESHVDTKALYRLIEETCEAGFDCELLVCLDGDENKTVSETFQIHLGDGQIDVNFSAAWEHKVLLYRFVR